MAEKSVIGQISIFDYLDVPALAPVNVKKAPKRGADSQACLDYLKKGEYLTSLAREAFEKRLSLHSLGELDERLCRLNLSKADSLEKTVSKIAQVMIRPMLTAIGDFESDDNYALLKSSIDYDFDIAPIDMGGNEGQLPAVKMLRYLYRKSSDVIRLTLREDGYPDLVVYGYKGFSHQGKKCRNSLLKDGTCVSDIAVILARLLCYTKFMRAMEDDALRNVIVNTIKDLELLSFDDIFRRGNNVPSRYSGMSVTELLTDSRTRAHVTLPARKIDRVSDAYVDYFFDRASLSKDDFLSSANCSDRDTCILNNESWDAGKRPFRYILTKYMGWSMFIDEPEDAWDHGLGRIRYNDVLYRIEEMHMDNEKIPSAWALPFGFGNGFDHFVDLVVAPCIHAVCAHDLKVSKEKSSFLKKAVEHARAYQDKKNIPERIVKEMMDSSFNKYFGYVEFDPSCDTEKIALIAEEFGSFHDAYLGKLDTGSVFLRFRRLGNHRAGGVYYPSVKCICVDLQNPDSMMHEYGHCIDHIEGKGCMLSESKDFYGVYKTYVKELDDRLWAEGRLNELKQSKAKYNYDYYVKPTEVFARCFEMYVVHTLGFASSICKRDMDESFAYPATEKLMEKIDPYFKELFSHYNNDADIAA